MLSQPSVQLIKAHQSIRLQEAAQARLVRQARGASQEGAAQPLWRLLGAAGQMVGRVVLRRHGPIKSFEHVVPAQEIAGRVDAGTQAVDTRKIVGSVGRTQTLRSDFFYRRGRAITARYRWVGEAMAKGVELPPLELYRVRHAAGRGPAGAASEYYVVDGHHRVAMARKLGQDFLDAHVVEYRLGGFTGSQE